MLSVQPAKAGTFCLLFSISSYDNIDRLTLHSKAFDSNREGTKSRRFAVVLELRDCSPAILSTRLDSFYETIPYLDDAVGTKERHS